MLSSRKKYSKWQPKFPCGCLYINEHYVETSARTPRLVHIYFITNYYVNTEKPPKLPSDVTCNRTLYNQHTNSCIIKKLFLTPLLKFVENKEICKQQYIFLMEYFLPFHFVQIFSYLPWFNTGIRYFVNKYTISYAICTPFMFFLSTAFLQDIRHKPNSTYQNQSKSY